MRRLRVLTWHVHGNYLLYLSQARADFYLPVGSGLGPGYSGRGATFPFGGNVHEVPVEAVRELGLDLILYQARTNYEVGRHRILSSSQRRLPRIYLEHDPPLERPTDQKHWFDDPDGLLVHVTPFNALMWESGATPTRVIEHGVMVPEHVRYSGEIPGGITAINNFATRGRRLGGDVFDRARRDVPIDLVGMSAEQMGGLGEIPPTELAAFMARYRFFFNPIRWTSLGLAVIEAMMIGLPIVGLATTEMVTTIEQGVSGFLETDLDRLVAGMHRLIAEPGEARRLGQNARASARERFHIDRFARDWEEAFALVAGRPRGVTG